MSAHGVCKTNIRMGLTRGNLYHSCLYTESTSCYRGGGHPVQHYIPADSRSGKYPYSQRPTPHKAICHPGAFTPAIPTFFPAVIRSIRSVDTRVTEIVSIMSKTPVLSARCDLHMTYLLSCFRSRAVANHPVVTAPYGVTREAEAQLQRL